MAQLTWDKTELKNGSRTKFTVTEIKQLLDNRKGRYKKSAKKTDLIKLLKSDYPVRIDQAKIEYFSFDRMKVKNLMIEFKLLGVDPNLFQSKLKRVLIFLLQNAYQSPKMKWKLLHHKYKMYSKPVLLNKNEFITVGNNSLLKYNINDNKWSEWLDYPYLVPIPTRMVGEDAHVVPCVDNRNNKIYIMGKTKLFTIDYMTESVENMDEIVNEYTWSDVPDNGSPIINIKQAKLILVDGKLHIIISGQEYQREGWLYKNKGIHFIFDQETRKLNRMHTFDSFETWTTFETVYLPLQERILLFEFWGMRNIYSYCCKTNKWTLLEAKLPNSYLSKCVVTADERFVILMSTKSGKMFIANTIDLKFEESVIHCPFNDCDGIIVSDQWKKELLTVGFVRDVYKKYEIGMCRFPPQYLIKLIEQRFNLDDYLHLFINNCASHFRVPLEHVMKKKAVMQEYE